MRAGQTAVTRRLDYQAPPWWIDTVDLTIDLDPAKTRVLSKLKVRRNPDVPAQALKLDGDELNLSRVQLNGEGCAFSMDGDSLILDSLPDGDAPLELEIFSTCAPDKNSKLMGLFMSGGDFFTQCESEGFRRITYFLDRPDVMATYTVTLRADKARWPVLLANGNLVESGDLQDGRHFATWHDPHKKPSYLFALVAGNLVAREQRIVTRSGNEHLLQVWVRPGDLDQTEHAMNALIHAITWDEARYGLKLDLERFMIVATSDFNFGAMENKGLNIFNSKYVLAKPSTATDADFHAIEGVIGHEYFHNWTGDRVTCRDWFQLTLKEGLTVFRDQSFSMDMAGGDSAKAIKRIGDVMVLRSAQFAEDAGPMAHPIRPDEYLEVTNFYTATVYEKGAEVVRMVETLLGRDGFRAGMDLYFKRHDGHAVTCDDFIQAMAEANPDSTLAHKLNTFKLWYSQAGTPVVTAQSQWDADAQTWTLHLAQHCPDTPGQSDKKPMLIPIRMGLIDANGNDMPLQLQAGELLRGDTIVLDTANISLTFTDLASEPVPSLLRGFSAPVKLKLPTNVDHLLHRLANDRDPFNRWDAGQQLALDLALKALTVDGDAPAAPLSDAWLTAARQVLTAPDLDPSFKALVLTLPGENYIADQLDGAVNPQRIHAVRQTMLAQMATHLHDDWQTAWEQNRQANSDAPDPVSSGQRALAGLALQMLCLDAQANGNTVWPGKAYGRVKSTSNMTDRQNALQALMGSGHELTDRALAHVHQLFQNDALVLDKWFAWQARMPDQQGSALVTVKRLMKHRDFTLNNPNRARSLLFNFCVGNPAGFHQADGSGYAYWAKQVLALDAINPQVAARLTRALDSWARLAEPYRQAAHDAIAKVAAHAELSNDVREVLNRLLAHDLQSPAHTQEQQP